MAMNKDAKIGVVVILIILGLLVIIWGRTDSDAERAEEAANPMTPPAASMGSEFTEEDPADEGFMSLRREDRQPPATDRRVIVKPKHPTGPVVAKKTTAPTGKMWYYKVANGDSLQTIARDQLGNWRLYKEIATLNRLAKPYMIRVNQKLKMPPKGQRVATTGQRSVALPVAKVAGKRRYVVQPGDIGLMEIARDRLGDWKKFADIRKLNTQLKPPYEIKTGDIIWLPTYQ